MNTYKIFISYKTTHEDEAKLLESMLISDDISILFAEDSYVDSLSDEEFCTLAKDTYAFVILLSDDNTGISYAEKELAYAVQNEISIIPVMLDDIELSGAVASYLSNVQRYSIADKENEVAMRTIATQILAMIEQERTASYSILEFFGRKFLFESKEALKSLKKLLIRKLKNTKVFFKNPKNGRKISRTIQISISILTAIYVYWGVRYSERLELFELLLISVPPMIVISLFSLITSYFIGKIKNNLISSIVTLILSCGLFMLQLYCSYLIIQYIINIFY